MALVTLAAPLTRVAPQVRTEDKRFISAWHSASALAGQSENPGPKYELGSTFGPVPTVRTPNLAARVKRMASSTCHTLQHVSTGLA